MAKKIAKKVAPKKSTKKVDYLQEVNESHNQIQAFVAELAEDLTKFEGGVTAAGRRLRKNCQGIKKSCQTMRFAVQNHINANK